MVRCLALTSAVAAALVTTASPAHADVRYCSPIAPSEDQARAGHYLQVCLRQDETGHFFADVDIDQSVYSSPAVRFHGRLQSSVVADRLGGWWVRLNRQEISVVPGQNLYTVELPHALADFEAFSEQTGIGWDSLGVCLDVIQLSRGVPSEPSVCSTGLATPTLERNG
jgi:hypothetical protein